MNTDLLAAELAKKYTTQFKYWYDLLTKIMPKYFFQTFSAAQIEEIMPILFNLHSLTGIQKIAHENSVILLYLKNDDTNLLATSKIMMEYNVCSAVIHESKQAIVINGRPQNLVIEYYTVAGTHPLVATPLVSFRELNEAYRSIFGKANPKLKEIYSRIKWDVVTDLTPDRLADRLHAALAIQDKDYPLVSVEKGESHELKITYARTNSPPKGIYFRVIAILNSYGFDINRVYARQITGQDNVTAFDRMPVTITTIYLKGHGLTPESRKIRELIWQMRHLSWCNMDDLLHRELVERFHWSLPDTNLMRAAATFLHSQLAFVDRNIYHHPDIWRLMVLHEPILRQLLALFQLFHRENDNSGNSSRRIRRIEREIAAVNTGIKDKDVMVKTIFSGLLNFIQCIRKTNFFTAEKACLSFRLDSVVMDYYANMSPVYREAFSGEAKPHGIFFFYRHNCLGFQVRFADIARGGWRTVIPQKSANALEKEDSYEFSRDELFREVYVLAHTQHLKNKDIYEGGAKMISLLRLEDGAELLPMLYQAQRTVSAAFLQLINYDRSGRLRAAQIVDRLGCREIIEIGPDENLHDVMINWMGNYAETQGYSLGSGLISGKPDRGINHKEYGVTSFGVHQYLLRALRELGINPETDPFSVKISGGPFGDVAGNELKLLLQKKADGSWLYPLLRITAITDGPAAVCDPDGIDRAELLRLIHQHNLDAFNPEKLTGDGAYIVYSATTSLKGSEQHRQLIRRHDGLKEKMIGGDEFMNLFQDNLCRYADVFIPCGGRPATIDISNWQRYVPDGKPGCRAIIEGANSFITPAARDRLQETGIMIVKDASANKCGVITSSYEILSGLMLSEAEFKKHKPELVREIMAKLQHSAEQEADWLFAQLKLAPDTKLTELTEQLSRQLNAKNTEVHAYLTAHPEREIAQIILDHLPPVLRKNFPDRIRRIPEEYRLTIASVELAARIIYRQSGDLATQINAVLK